MYWNRAAADILRDWDAEIAVKLETGATPLLVTGAPTSALPALPGLEATQILAQTRRDLTLPLVPVGGASPVWLGWLLAPLPAGDGPWSRDPTVVYSGADPITVQAGLAAVAADVTAPALGEGIPAHVALELAPRLLPGATVPWEAFPFLDVGEARQVPPAAAHGQTVPPSLTDWTGWGALMLALGLLLSAVLI